MKVSINPFGVRKRQFVLFIDKLKDTDRFPDACRRRWPGRWPATTFAPSGQELGVRD